MIAHGKRATQLRCESVMRLIISMHHFNHSINILHKNRDGHIDLNVNVLKPEKLDDDLDIIFKAFSTSKLFILCLNCSQRLAAMDLVYIRFTY